MNVLSLDTETTIHNKGNPYDSRNKLVCWSFASEHNNDACWFKGPHHTQACIDDADLIIGFNFKFDYHWLHKHGVNLRHKKIWDVQIAEFILSHQAHKFPSLNETCEKYGIPLKLDVVNTEYWEKGIQTDQIPWDILREYAAHDAKVTLMCYHAQLKLMTEKQKQLCRLMCMDLHVLQDMECNGLMYDENLCEKRAKEVEQKIETIKTKLANIYPNVPINFNSGDHLSAFLYGGIVTESVKQHVGFFKNGNPKMKYVDVPHVLPRLYTPLKGSELKKADMFATDEGTLRKLKGKKETVRLLLELAKLEKLNGTYYKGLTELRKTMHWPENILHGQFNQTMVSTGRLSSNKPNLQNFATELGDIFISRFNE